MSTKLPIIRDFTIQLPNANDKIISCEGIVHYYDRFVLGRLSKYFEAAFSGPYVESTKGVELNYKASTINIILNYIDSIFHITDNSYDDRQRQKMYVTIENVFELSDISQYLQMDLLHSTCMDFILRNYIQLLAHHGLKKYVTQTRIYMEKESNKEFYDQLIKYHRKMNMSFYETDPEVQTISVNDIDYITGYDMFRFLKFSYHWLQAENNRVHYLDRILLDIAHQSQFVDAHWEYIEKIMELKDKDHIFLAIIKAMKKSDEL
jgi:hypothetical protein